MTSAPPASMAQMLGVSDASTFLGIESCDVDALPTDVSVDVVVFGAPCVTPYARVGAYCADGPRAIRHASATYASTRTHMNFDLGGATLPDAVRAVDLGDVAGDDDHERNRAEVRRWTSAALAAGAVPVVLGGDDSTPIPVVQAYADRVPVCIVQVDAHIDWRDDVDGERWGLSSTMRRCSEMPHVGEMIQVGQRGSGSARAADLDAAHRRGVHFVPAAWVHANGVQQAIDSVPAGGRTFLSIDVDGLDPSIVPGVIGPEPGGLWYHQITALIDGVAERSTIAGVAIVEFMPSRDLHGSGALTVFRVAAHAIGRIAAQR